MPLAPPGPWRRRPAIPIEAGFQLLKMAAAGKRFLAGHNYSAHYTVEGVCQADVNAKLALLRQAMDGIGTETANTIPTVIRAMPFIPLYPILGPKGERWVPQHGIMPFSKTAEFHRKLQKLYADNAERMRKAKVDKGTMYMTINTHAFLYEPVFYWEDDRTSFHKRFLPADYLKMLPEYPANPEGRALVRELRQKIAEIFASVGAVHMQVGKSYPYMQGPRSGGGAAAARAEEEPGPPEPDEPRRAGLVGAPSAPIPALDLKDAQTKRATPTGDGPASFMVRSAVRWSPSPPASSSFRPAATGASRWASKA